MRFLVLSSLLLGACGGGGGATSVPGDFKPTGEKLLTVDGKYDITQDMVDAVTRLTPEAEIESLKQSGSYSTMVEQIGLGEVLYREALKENLHKDPAIQKALMMKEREAWPRSSCRSASSPASPPKRCSGSTTSAACSTSARRRAPATSSCRRRRSRARS
ncbi:MAG: hypothetical protein H6737_04185 [Alphaproteobacteria bacterium]|nr:hypothetical protein [Alphaproteobacteria bacterium]